MNIYGFDDYGNKIKIGEYRRILPVGGTIFYEDTTADGVYKLYNENLVETSVLSEAKYYEVMTPGTKDRYYVYDSTTGLVNDKSWGYKDITTGASTYTIGSGKTNTNTILAIEDTSSYSSNSIFTYLKNTQNAGNGVAGCKDWFVGSKEEQDKLKESGLVTFYTDKRIWSSIEISGLNAQFWYSDGLFWASGGKDSSCSVVFLRAF